jgi:hypothetical protein
MRDVAEHINDYAVDCGKDQNISRKSLEVSSTDGDTWNWLGFEMDTRNSLRASIQLFEAIKESQSQLKEPNKRVNGDNAK